MAGTSIFPQSIEYDGTTWHLSYDPSCETTVMPSINEKDVQRITCDTVQFPGRDTPIWLIVVNVVIPSRMDGSGNLIGARRMLGFRTFDRQPSPAYRVQPNELVYYVAEQSDGSAAQRLFNAITGLDHTRQTASVKPDTSWCKSLAPQISQAEPVPAEIVLGEGCNQ